MTSFLSVTGGLSIGLMIGVELAVWTFINPILWKLDKRARAQAVQLFARRLGKAMPFWYSGNLVLLIAEAVLLRHQPSAGLLDAAAALWLAIIVLTLIFLVPINNRLAREDSTMSLDDAHREHKRWDAYHRARVVVLVVAMATFLVAIHC
jgi:uncharacterized membrane protein